MHTHVHVQLHVLQAPRVLTVVQLCGCFVVSVDIQAAKMVLKWHDGWTDRQMHGGVTGRGEIDESVEWTNRWVNKHMVGCSNDLNRQVDRKTVECTNRCVHACMYRHMHAQMDGWMMRGPPHRLSHLRQVEHFCVIWCLVAHVKAAHDVAKGMGGEVHILQLLDA